MLVIIHEEKKRLTIDERSVIGISVTIPFDLYSSYDAAVVCEHLPFKPEQLNLFCR